MGRLIGAVVLGYVIMMVFVFATFSAAYLAMGTEGSFKPDSYDVSTLWVALSIGLGLVAAILGGWVAAAVARGPKGSHVLAVVVFVVGIVMALPAVTSPPEDRQEVRGAEVGNLEAMQYAKQPTWMLLFNPVLGAVGALVGGRLRKRS
jgi:cytochrome bd-type quinol oxidase subunit 2